MSNFLKIGLAQMTSIDSLEVNLETIRNLLNSLTDYPDIIFFPENVFYFRLDKKEVFEGFSIQETFFKEFQTFCDEKNTSLHWGSVAIQEQGKCYNACVLQKPNEKARVSYKKIHLFSFSSEKLVLKEANQYARGDKEQIFFHGDWSLGQSICYDLRFSELYSRYAQFPVDIILAPSAFTQQTGSFHWHSLLKARAIESQCFCVASGQSGEHKGIRGDKYFSYGHSLVVSPWGDILLDLDKEAPVIKTICLDKRDIEKVRRKIPMLGHRTLLKKDI